MAVPDVSFSENSWNSLLAISDRAVQMAAHAYNGDMLPDSDTAQPPSWQAITSNEDGSKCAKRHESVQFRVRSILALRPLREISAAVDAMNRYLLDTNIPDETVVSYLRTCKSFEINSFSSFFACELVDALAEKDIIFAASKDHDTHSSSARNFAIEVISASIKAAMTHTYGIIRPKSSVERKSDSEIANNSERFSAVDRPILVNGIPITQDLPPAIFAAITTLSKEDCIRLANLGTLSSDEISYLTDKFRKEVGGVSDALQRINEIRTRRNILEKTISNLKAIILGDVRATSVTSLDIAELEAMYTAVAIISGPDIYSQYTEQSFDYELWQDLIKQPQNLNLVEKANNHLHYSNLLTAQRIIVDIMKRVDADDERRLQRGDTIRLLEAGSGGCNTSYAVISAIKTDCRLERLDLNIEFLGFEINERFAVWGNQLFKGVPWVGIDDDPRAKIFCDEKIRPWPGQKQYICNDDAGRGITQILRNNENLISTVDYFFSSYMLHHIPNGDALLRFLLGPNKSRIHRNYANFGNENYANKFAAETIKYLKLMTERSPMIEDMGRRIDMQMSLVEGASSKIDLSNVIGAVAYLLAWHIFESSQLTRDRDVDVLERKIRESISKSQKYEHSPYEYDWTREFINDPQRILFWAIERLLKPSGLMVIADPDGTSSFNRINAARNDQMATELMVAQFRNFDRLSDVLRSRPLYFDVEPEVRVVKTRSGDYDRECGPKVNPILMSVNRDIDDNNMGYFLCAKKRSRS